MSNDFWRGWWWSRILHDGGSKPPQPMAGGGGGGGPGCLILMIGWPLLLECFAVGAAVFQFVSFPPGRDGDLAIPFIQSMGLPGFFGWWAGLMVAIVYLSSHGFWPLGLALTVLWTPIWALFGHQFDVPGFDADQVIETFFTQGWEATAPLLVGQSWKWGFFCGVTSLIGHLGMTVAGMATARRQVSLKERGEDIVILAGITFAIVCIFWFVLTLGSAIHDPL